MFQVYYTSRNLLSRFISFEITPAKLKGGLPAPLSPTYPKLVKQGSEIKPLTKEIWGEHRFNQIKNLSSLSILLPMLFFSPFSLADRQCNTYLFCKQ